MVGNFVTDCLFFFLDTQLSGEYLKIERVIPCLLLSAD